jgi:hypothetical protein
MGARNRIGIGLSYRTARLHRLAESILGLLKCLKIRAKRLWSDYIARANPQPVTHLARTHYWPTWELLSAGFPPWPVASLLRSNLIPSDFSQGSMLMLALVRTPVQHDPGRGQWPPGSGHPTIWPPCSRITGVRHHSQLFYLILFVYFFTGLECVGYSFAYVAQFFIF